VGAPQTIEGLQSNGLQAYAKHFLANEKETQRSNTAIGNGTQVNAISSNVDDLSLSRNFR